ncbi:MAG: Uncharacterized protein G01um101420_71 [Parcubacteria group bacterium Gr01-1014_20]|nr:MAG: Uncharacterized protein G01um101420_71 [Parcubacteria group bacterium Gr01-1014_20]
MNDFDIPIFKKIYDLYKSFYVLRKNFPKDDKYILGEKCESLILEVLTCVFEASQKPKPQRLVYLEGASVKINLLRFHFRLAKDVRALSEKNYLNLQENLDEIGRMLGGWIRMTKS